MTMRMTSTCVLGMAAALAVASAAPVRAQQRDTTGASAADSTRHRTSARSTRRIHVSKETTDTGMTTKTSPGRRMRDTTGMQRDTTGMTPPTPPPTTPPPTATPPAPTAVPPATPPTDTMGGMRRDSMRTDTTRIRPPDTTARTRPDSMRRDTTTRPPTGAPGAAVPAPGDSLRRDTSGVRGTTTPPPMQTSRAGFVLDGAGLALGTGPADPCIASRHVTAVTRDRNARRVPSVL